MRVSPATGVLSAHGSVRASVHFVSPTVGTWTGALALRVTGAQADVAARLALVVSASCVPFQVCIICGVVERYRFDNMAYLTLTTPGHSLQVMLEPPVVTFAGELTLDQRHTQDVVFVNNSSAPVRFSCPPTVRVPPPTSPFAAHCGINPCPPGLRPQVTPCGILTVSPAHGVVAAASTQPLRLTLLPRARGKLHDTVLFSVELGSPLPLLVRPCHRERSKMYDQYCLVQSPVQPRHPLTRHPVATRIRRFAGQSPGQPLLLRK